MKTAKKGILFAGALAALVGLAAGCSSGQRFVYVPEATTYAPFDLGAEPREDVLQRCLDNIVASGVLDPDIVPELSNMAYTFDEEDREWEDFFSRSERADFSFAYFGESDENQLDKPLLCATAVHDLAHDFFEYKLTQGERDAFRGTVLWLKGIYDDEIQPQEGLGIENFGFTPETFGNFESFLAWENEYRKQYGDWFDECFYGSEAFAHIVGPEVMIKLAHTAILNTSHSEDSLLDRREREIATANLEELVYIPSHIVEFYRGFLSSSYFDEPNPAYLDSTQTFIK